MKNSVPIDIISGFLGSGKTTLLNALLKNQYRDKSIAVIENEFGEVDVDSSLLPREIEITKITGGCVCCTLKAGLIDGIHSLIDSFDLDRIVIETTGVARLSDVMSAVQSDSLKKTVHCANCITVVNPDFHVKLSDSLGSFYEDQIKNANTIYISRKEIIEEKTLQKAIVSIRAVNSTCNISYSVKDLDLNDLNVKRVDLSKHAHEHCHNDKDKVFESQYISVDGLDNTADLEEMIAKIIGDNKPKTVYRIKGSVLIAGKSTLVQWANGELDLQSIDTHQNKLVIVIG